MSSLAAFHVLCCLSFLLGTQHVQGTRIKIHLPESFRETYRRRLVSLQQEGHSCEDYEEVPRSSLDLPGRLNDLDDRVKFYRSPSATANLKAFEEVLIPGLGGDNVGDVFAVLRAGECLPFFYGGAVRDQFLGRTPRDADVEVDCTLDEVMEICRAEWGESNCYHREGSPAAHIGTSGMDLASTDITFYASLCDLEYTVNSMAYDTNGNDVIIDLTANGATNACEQQIAIPSDDNSKRSYNCWYKVGGDWILFRAWKLRTKDLNFYSAQTERFIKSRVRNSVMTDPDLFGAFYCRTIYYSSYDTDAKKCIVSTSECIDGEDNAYKYQKSFEDDFSSRNFYAKYMLPIIESAEVDCTNPPARWMKVPRLRGF